MRVLMTTMKLDIGGAETHIVELSKALAQRGIEVTVASNGGAYEKELKDAGITHIKIPFHSKSPKYMVKAYDMLKKLIFDKKFDIVHAHARIPAFLCYLLQKKYHFRFVTTAHWVFSTRFPYNMLTRWGHRSLAVSDDIKAYLIDNYNVPSDNIRVTINGINLDKFSTDTDFSDIMSEFSLNPSATRVVYVSRMDEDRSLAAHKLIEATANIDAAMKALGKELEIVIVGGGNDYNRIYSEAERVNKQLGRRVIITTNSRTDINKFTASGDVFVGVSRAALEAMACAKPAVIAGNEGYIGVFDKDKLKVSIDTNFCCRGCTPTETETLKQDIIKILSMSVAERKELGDYSRATVAKHYSMTTMADDAIKMYISCIKNSRVNDVKIQELDNIDDYLVINPLREKSKSTDVLISGYYGFGNSGDDSILYAIIRELKLINPNIKIAALSKTPDTTSHIYGVDGINRFNIFSIIHCLKNTKLLISGGGSLIQDVTSTKSLAYYLFIIRLAKLMNKKVMLYANGIGPVNNTSNYKMVKKVLNRVDLITLRDPDSLTELKKFGIDKPQITVTADPAFNLFSASYDMVYEYLTSLGLKDNDKYFVTAVRPWKTADDNFCREIAKTTDYVCDKYNLKCVFLQMQPQRDGVLTQNCANLMKNKPFIIDKNLSPDLTLGITENADFVIGMRLHTLIYAAKCKTPVIGISYDPKVDSMMDYMGQKYHLSADSVTSSSLCSFIDEIIKSYDDISNSLAKISADYAKLATDNAKFALKLINNK